MSAPNPEPLSPGSKLASFKRNVSIDLRKVEQDRNEPVIELLATPTLNEVEAALEKEILGVKSGEDSTKS